MTDFKQKAIDLVAQMTLSEKTSLLSGENTWQTKEIKRLGVPSLMMTDGPHGLRKQEDQSDNLGINASKKATAFPPAVTSAGAFDRELLYEMGVALGEEARAEQVSVLLGPGINIKRSPLCGRNFEYFSEDPYISGELGTAYIKGVQSKGIGVSLKHFAANSQEKWRMVSDSIVDERALREIYLSAFEKCVKNAQPWTVMSSYNKLNGIYTSESHRLLTEILRDEWGFDGVVISDWSAVNDRVIGVRAGLDLEMPNSGNFLDKIVAEAVKTGQLSETDLDKCVIRLVELALKAKKNKYFAATFSKEKHHQLACKIARESAVLLKNEAQILPISADKKIAIIGEFAKKPRYQGAGSSRINPFKVDNAFDALKTAGYALEYASGKDLEKVTRLASECDLVLVFVGLTDDYESEGFDRETLAMPDSHNHMIETAAKANSQTIVVLQCGSPVAMPWADKVKGILLTYLCGQAGGQATADLLTGAQSPSGKLAETWPLKLEDTPSYRYFATNSRLVTYRESLFVGYRYYDTVACDVAYPFGYGLTYTDFIYSKAQITETGAKVTIENVGKMTGAEIVQLYIAAPADSKRPRPAHELKGFDKITLNPGEKKVVNFSYDDRTFAYYDVEKADWVTETGTYTVQIAASSRDIKASGEIQIQGIEPSQTVNAVYQNIASAIDETGIFSISDEEFAKIYGNELPQELPTQPYHANSTLGDIQHTLIGKAIAKVARNKQEATLTAGGTKEEEDDGWRKMFEASLMETPLRGLAMMSEGVVTPKRLTAMLDLLNHKPVQAVKGLFGKSK
ncbi:glycosyl hydrolase [Lactococcus hodotermopsidis]|uniref:Glycosyl hydrolase n=1 Tax=Pseudolactococcus hodotermopsidis TaxID=2709157 RepID=A0A6A0BBI6_9LACT|nr:glycoside hydrolase family 3 C-terminal domain-containing protein [Lactococcus hodotermopsidis]GFH41778.1 glycosyl hydrolase [Lactococcus hodotermopsidis]